MLRPLVLVLASLCLAACDGNPPPERCSTDKDWTSGDSESPLMHPGGDCISCHKSSDAPRFDVAGTVMKDERDDTDCDGIEGVLVQITGAKGDVVELKTNAAGNFFRTVGEGDPIEAPYTAKLVFQGRERPMLMHQTVTDCPSCHTATGLHGAPGRILVP